MVKAFRLPATDLAAFIERLAGQYTILGPVPRGPGAVFGEVKTADQLKLDFEQTFYSPKKYFHPPVQTLITFQDRQVEKAGEADESANPRIIFGVRPCDVNALTSLDQVFGEAYPDPYYQQQRKNTYHYKLEMYQELMRM